ncbi:DUF4325 domain-containing protein [Xanthomonas campestris]|uniref:STAS-like domain-containing protein n=1 Tax=Xanthomonas campestris TaxID=339 RepID=UPI000CDA3364|nr:STAS-like domain-containing protein [Xanthomonas campestris]TXD43129.1 DUF4325 domain-containing protein [Xanthomonas campestris]
MASDEIKMIDIGRDFSPVPAGRHRADGDFSGEVFRDEFLAPALRSASLVTVVLDNTEGFGSSFLEEAFGGLVRNCGFSKNTLHKQLQLVANSPAAKRYSAKILQYIDQASPARP